MYQQQQSFLGDGSDSLIFDGLTDDFEQFSSAFGSQGYFSSSSPPNAGAEHHGASGQAVPQGYAPPSGSKPGRGGVGQDIMRGIPGADLMGNDLKKAQRKKKSHFSYMDDDSPAMQSAAAAAEEVAHQTIGKRSNRVPKSRNESERLARSRERNRLHARNSRLRKKIYIDSLKQTIHKLEDQNNRLKLLLKQHNPELFAKAFLSDTLGGDTPATLPVSSAAAPATQKKAGTVLAVSDFALVEALQHSMQNFVITDPKLPDNPIIFASHNFFILTQYPQNEVIGRNCRFLQGPKTDPFTIQKIRKGIENKEDTEVIILNYRKDGTQFWNKLFVAPLKNSVGDVVNFIAVQCVLSEDIALKILEAQNNAAASEPEPDVPLPASTAAPDQSKIAY